MSDMAQECYVVAIDTETIVSRPSSGYGKGTKALSIFSSRDVAPKRGRDKDEPPGRSVGSRQVDADELRHILICARDEGYTHVTLDGREMGIDGFRTLLDHEQLE